MKEFEPSLRGGRRPTPVGQAAVGRAKQSAFVDCFGPLGLAMTMLPIILILSASSPAFAYNPSEKGDPAAKFGRGVTNILSGPLEYLVQFRELDKKHGPATATFGMLLRGTAFFVFRELMGIYEVITFPFPVPENYEPLWEPPTTFEALSKEY